MRYNPSFATVVPEGYVVEKVQRTGDWRWRHKESGEVSFQAWDKRLIEYSARKNAQRLGNWP